MKSIAVSILGCGWLGKGLAASLMKNGHRVKGSTTTASKAESLAQVAIEPYLIKFSAGNLPLYDPGFFECDVFIVAFNVGLQRRPDYLAEVGKLIHLLQLHAVRKVFYISSISVYGNPNLEVNELTAPDPKTSSAGLLHEAENMLLAQRRLHVTVIRFGGLIGPGRMPGRFLSGKKEIPDGLSPVNLIHLDDCTGLLLTLIETGHDATLLNAVAPHHPTKQDFYTRAARNEGLPTPEFVAEQTNWKIVSSRYTDGFYKYRINNLLTWLEQ